MPVLCALGANLATLLARPRSPGCVRQICSLGPGTIAGIRCVPSSVNERGHAVSLGVGDPGQVTLVARPPESVQLSDADEALGGRIPPILR